MNTDDPHRDQPVLTGGQALNSASAAVILLHGRGASAEDILGLSDELEHPELAYLAPQAAGHTWYPYSFLNPIEANQPWLDSALGAVGAVVAKVEAAGIARNKIVVLGFSQGACLATEFAARNASRFGGVVAFTGGLIGPAGTRFNFRGDLANTPCFLGSGDPDPHVPWKRVQESAAILTSLGAYVTLRRYPGLPHTISENEMGYAKQILAGLGKG